MNAERGRRIGRRLDRFAGGALVWLLVVNLARADETSTRSPITALAFDAQGESLVSGSQHGLRIHRASDLQEVSALDTGLEHVHDLAFSPDGQRLAAAGGTPGEAGTLEVWSWPSRERIFTRTHHEDVLHAVAWRDDGKQIALASHDGKVSICAADDGRQERVLPGHSRPVLAVAFPGGDDTLVSAGVDHSLRVWRAASGETLHVLENHTQPVSALVATAPASHGQAAVVSAGADGTVRLWYPTIGRLVRFARLESEPQAIVRIEEGDRVAVACRDGAVRVVDVTRAVVIATLEAGASPAHAIAVQPGTNRVVVGTAAGRLRSIPLDRTPDEDNASTKESPR